MYKAFYLDLFLSSLYLSTKYPFFARKKKKQNWDKIRQKRFKWKYYFRLSVRGLVFSNPKFIRNYSPHDLKNPLKTHYRIHRPWLIRSFTERRISFKNYQPKLFPTLHFSLCRRKRFVAFKTIHELENMKETRRFLKINLFVKKHLLLDFCPTWNYTARKSIRLASSLRYQFRILKKFFGLFRYIFSITVLVFLRELRFSLHKPLRLVMSYLKLKSSPFLFFYLPTHKEGRLKKVRKKKKFKYKQFFKKFNQSLRMV